MGLEFSRRLAAFLGVVAVAFAFRAMLSYYLAPQTDVYYYDSQAVSALLGGTDPYGHIFTGVPSNLITPGAQAVFAYLPGVFLLLVPLASFDVRVAIVASEILVAFGIYALAGRWSVLCSALFLLLPFSALIAVVYPNNILPAMSFLGLGVLLESKGRRIPSAVALGLAAASSQFMWLAYPFFAISWYRDRRWAEIALSLVTAVAIILPFLAWNAAAFIQDTLVFEFTRPVFPLVSNAPWGLNLNPSLSGLAQSLAGAPVPSLIRIAVALVAMVFFLRRAGGLGSTLMNLGYFLVLAVLVLPGNFFWVYLELPFQAILMSLAMRSLRETASSLNA